jgi:hypothetical protein
MIDFFLSVLHLKKPTPTSFSAIFALKLRGPDILLAFAISNIKFSLAVMHLKGI